MKIKQYQLRFTCIATLCCMNMAFGAHVGSVGMILTGFIGLCYIPVGLSWRHRVTSACSVA
jgi:hypothetical protein